MPRDRNSRNSFKILDLGHQKTVDEAHLHSDGTCGFLGTWHTHPETCPTPSKVDKADWRCCLRRNRDRPLVFAIVGAEHTRIFMKWGPIFQSLKPFGSRET